MGKKCNHIYEKATIYGMIDQARQNDKPVRCPYMGCNQKDFKKTDLVKDREVAKHLEEKRGEKERDDLEEAEQDGPEDDDSSRLEESSSGSSQPPSATNSSSKSPSADNNGEDEGISSTLEPEPSKGKVSRK